MTENTEDSGQSEKEESGLLHDDLGCRLRTSRLLQTVNRGLFLR